MAQNKLADRQLTLSMKSEELSAMKLVQRDQFVKNHQQQEIDLGESLRRQAQM